MHSLTSMNLSKTWMKRFNLIESEKKNFRPFNYLAKYKNIAEPFSSKIVAAEHERIYQQFPQDEFDTSKLQLVTPNAKADAKQWNSAVENAEAQFEHQNLQLVNLELMQKYGRNAWIEYNKYLEKTQKNLEERVQSIQREIDDLNLKRRNEQVDCERGMKSLEGKRLDLIQKNLELEEVCESLEEEIEELEKSRGMNGEVNGEKK
eukprot:TRINITY_DN2318_c0_g1_i2.p1 TRINITY_DN2318_c0_g1~~TRINITY_DN2318_c0_g1_i2.p1  ORF type:complete len:205 (-),score=66.85 TRINITY_DN2318_c0_g1_i2:21-635(-)